MDRAIRLHEPMREFLRQDMFASADLQHSVDAMLAALEDPGLR